MDVHIRGIKSKVWKRIKVRALKRGITVAEVIEDLWATSSPRAQESPKRPRATEQVEEFDEEDDETENEKQSYLISKEVKEFMKRYNVSEKELLQRAALDNLDEYNLFLDGNTIRGL